MRDNFLMGTYYIGIIGILSFLQTFAKVDLLCSNNGFNRRFVRLEQHLPYNLLTTRSFDYKFKLTCRLLKIRLKQNNNKRIPNCSRNILYSRFQAGDYLAQIIQIIVFQLHNTICIDVIMYIYLNRIIIIIVIRYLFIYFATKYLYTYGIDYRIIVVYYSLL